MPTTHVSCGHFTVIIIRILQHLVQHWSPHISLKKIIRGVVLPLPLHENHQSGFLALLKHHPTFQRLNTTYPFFPNISAPSHLHCFIKTSENFPHTKVQLKPRWRSSHLFPRMSPRPQNLPECPKLCTPP